MKIKQPDRTRSLFVMLAVLFFFCNMSEHLLLAEDCAPDCSLVHSLLKCLKKKQPKNDLQS